jgi:WD40 repeat protein
VRGTGLLGKVRFPLMEERYLAGLSREGCGELAGLAELVGEAVGLKSVGRDEWGRQRLRHLDGRAVVGRRGGVKWEEYVGGGERRLDAGDSVRSVAADGGYVCGGLSDGSIRVWSRSTLELERTLTGHGDGVFALLFVGGKLISGSYDGCIRVWDVDAGRCEGVLEGHTGCVISLAVCGSRLLSLSNNGSNDGAVRVWVMDGEVSRWRCERTLDVIRSDVMSLVAWGDRVAGGCRDGGIRVWSSETWALERTLRGHDRGIFRGVFSMAVTGRGLISSSMDGTVRVWSTETWACVQTVEAYPAGSHQSIDRLAVSGPTLVGGSAGSGRAETSEVRVWDLETLRPLHTLVQPEGANVRSLVCDGREAMAGVGKQVVVWGRRG